MNIVKGDIVYVRSGKDVANRDSRLRAALGIKGAAEFQAAREKMEMTEQLALADKEPGVRGRVISIINDKGKVVVEGVNMVTKHQRPRQTSGAAQVQQGGRIQMEAAVPVSRVMLVCSNCDRPTRVGTQVRPGPQRPTLTGMRTTRIRERVCKHCGEVIPRPTDRAGL